MKPRKSLVGSEAHSNECHERWQKRRNRNTNSAEYKDQWYAEQCGGCIYWIPLTGQWGEDYGVCSNKQCAFDGTVRFEHDGCECHVPAKDWVTPVE